MRKIPPWRRPRSLIRKKIMRRRSSYMRESWRAMASLPPFIIIWEIPIIRRVRSLRLYWTTNVVFCWIRVIAMLASIYRWPVRRPSIRLSRLVISSWSNGLRAWRTSVPQTLGRRQVSCASCCLSVAWSCSFSLVGYAWRRSVSIWVSYLLSWLFLPIYSPATRRMRW